MESIGINQGKMTGSVAKTLEDLSKGIANCSWLNKDSQIISYDI